MEMIIFLFYILNSSTVTVKIGWKFELFVQIHKFEINMHMLRFNVPQIHVDKFVQFLLGRYVQYWHLGDFHSQKVDTRKTRVFWSPLFPKKPPNPPMATSLPTSLVFTLQGGHPGALIFPLKGLWGRHVQTKAPIRTNDTYRASPDQRRFDIGPEFALPRWKDAELVGPS